MLIAIKLSYTNHILCLDITVAYSIAKITNFKQVLINNYKIMLHRPEFHTVFRHKLLQYCKNLKKFKIIINK